MSWKKELISRSSFSKRLGLSVLSSVCDGARLLYQKNESPHALLFWSRIEQKWQAMAGVVQFIPYARYQNIAVMDDKEIAAAFAECMRIVRRDESKEVKLEDFK